MYSIYFHTSENEVSWVIFSLINEMETEVRYHIHKLDQLLKLFFYSVDMVTKISSKLTIGLVSFPFPVP